MDEGEGFVGRSWGMLSSLFRMRGSVWNAAWPFVLANTIFALLIHLVSSGVLDHHIGKFRLGIPEQGHKYSAPLVSFFIVTRVSQSYSRYLTGRQELGNALQKCSEIVTLAVMLTRSSRGSAAVHRWRNGIAHHVKLFVTGLMALTQSDKGRLDRELSAAQREKLHAIVHWDTTGLEAIDPDTLLEKQIYGLNLLLRRAVMEEKAIMGDADSIGNPGVLALEQRIMALTTAYNALHRLVTVQLPFPLLQMSRTLLFTWVFTIPFVLEKYMGMLSPCFTFFMTFTFIGLEFTAIELDDPFGDDPNDIPVESMCYAMLEDIGMALCEAEYHERDRDAVNEGTGQSPRNAAGSAAGSSADSLSRPGPRATAAARAADTGQAGSGGAFRLYERQWRQVAPLATQEPRAGSPPNYQAIPRGSVSSRADQVSPVRGRAASGSLGTSWMDLIRDPDPTRPLA
jgi:putative membrane protein